MTRFAYFNKLPVRVEYIKEVKRLLVNGDFSLDQIFKKTRLTKTQAGCAVDALIKKGEVQVIEESGRKIMRLTRD